MHRTNAKLEFFTGKGGVGKSTLVAASAVLAAQRGHSPLIVELSSRPVMGRIFETEAPSFESKEVYKGVFAKHISFRPALIEYMATYLKLRSLARAVLSSEMLQAFFMATPGAVEVATLHHIQRIVESGRHDRVLVDVGSSSAAAMFFSLPFALAKIATDGPLAEHVDRFVSLLTDQERTTLNVVSTNDPFSINQAIGVMESIDTMSLASGSVYANRLDISSNDIPAIEENLKQLERPIVRIAELDDPRPEHVAEILAVQL